jgi:integrase
LSGRRLEDVDFIRRRVRVERKIVEPGRMIAGEPKTRGSKRWVTLPESITLHLSGHVRQFKRGEVLFPGPDGGPLHRKTFHRAWEKATAEVGVPGFQFRNLRHCGATWALQEGVSPSWWPSGWATAPHG